MQKTIAFGEVACILLHVKVDVFTKVGNVHVHG
jgi:hypothetical protein